MLSSTLFIGILLATMASSWHCALMCGGIAASIDQSVAKIKVYPNRSKVVWDQMVVHLARIASYMALGAGAAWLGIAFWRQEVIPIQRALFGITAGILFYQAYRLINPSGKRITHLFGQTIAQALSQWWAKHFTKSRTGLARWITGMLWGLVPCSLVYGVLALAFLSGDPIVGALLMLAMGLGTLPSLLILTKVSGALMQFGQKAWVRYLAALLLIVTAVYGFYRGMTLPAELLKGGFCLT